VLGGLPGRDKPFRCVKIGRGWGDVDAITCTLAVEGGVWVGVGDMLVGRGVVCVWETTGAREGMDVRGGKVVESVVEVVRGWRGFERGLWQFLVVSLGDGMALC